jgi:hypothetical protein
LETVIIPTTTEELTYFDLDSPYMPETSSLKLNGPSKAPGGMPETNSLKVNGPSKAPGGMPETTSLKVNGPSKARGDMPETTSLKVNGPSKARGGKDIRLLFPKPKKVAPTLSMVVRSIQHQGVRKAVSKYNIALYIRNNNNVETDLIKV